VADSKVGALQIGRRAMVVCAALVVPPESPVYTPQELANKMVALDYGNGTAYAALQMLEGAMPRSAITTCAATVYPAERFRNLMAGTCDATVLQEPWITIAEKAGCRVVATTYFHGTWVADPSVSAATYGAFLRGITQAVRRINANKRKYVEYYIRELPDDPLVQALTPADFPLNRIQVQEPTPIPEHEARWAWEWMAGWGLLQGDFDVASQINRGIERAAHERAALVGSAG
jgi:ABC-type nitrate/sulfonate/bicarbonate transport system substrate-binding protein